MAKNEKLNEEATMNNNIGSSTLRFHKGYNFKSNEVMGKERNKEKRNKRDLKK